MDPKLARALQFRQQLIRHLGEVEPANFVERLPNVFREVARMALAAAHELDPPSEERDEARLQRLLAESAAAAKERQT
jgi:hypothetical protein